MEELNIPDNYYLKHPEPIQGCLLALRRFILKADNRINETSKYQIPFFFFKGEKLCFLWVNRKKLILGFVTDKTIYPIIERGKKDEMEMIQIDPDEDLPVEMIREKLHLLMKLYE